MKNIFSFGMGFVLIAGAFSAVSADTLTSSAKPPVFEQVRDNVVEVRTLVRNSDTPSSTGTGFLVTADGVMVTNYHVVSEHVMEPELYKLHYETHDHHKGSLELLAIDVVNDLAIVKSDLKPLHPLVFSQTPLTKGENGFSLGYPLKQGLTVIDGTFNGVSEESYLPLFHFTSAINAGMSGGPAVKDDGSVFGVNVSKLTGGAQMVGFLVPGIYAQNLLRTAQTEKPPTDYKAVAWRQVKQHGKQLFRAIQEHLWEAQTLGDFVVPGKLLPAMNCGRSVNTEEGKSYQTETVSCSVRSELYLSSELNVGFVSSSHAVYRNLTLNGLQWANLMERQFSASATGKKAKKNYLLLTCVDRIVALDGFQAKTLVCSSAYRLDPSLRDFGVLVLALPDRDEVLLSTLSLIGVEQEPGLALIERFLGGLRWKD